MSEPPNGENPWWTQYPAHPPRTDEPQYQRGNPDNPGWAVLSGCLSSFGFVVLAVVLGFVVVTGSSRLGSLVLAIVLGAVALGGIPLLFVRKWAVRGIGIGLLLGWGIATVVSGGVCTGLHSIG